MAAPLPPSGQSDWTLNTLYLYFTKELEGIATAIIKADAATDRRLDGMNEFRDALEDSDRDNVKQPQYKADMEGLRTKIDTAFSLTGKRVDDLSAQMGVLIGLVNEASKSAATVKALAEATKTGRDAGWKDIALLITTALAVLALAKAFLP